MPRMGATFRDGVVGLSDGRAAAYREWGDPMGRSMVFCHGYPHSRLFCPDEEATRRAGVRLVVPDRPGFGRSDPRANLTIGSWVADVAELVDTLGIEGFTVVGWSGGGPYAVACAALLSSRVTGVGIVNSGSITTYALENRPERYERLDEDDRRLFDLTKEDPDQAIEVTCAAESEWVQGLSERPESILEGYEIPEGDRWFYENPERLRPWLEAVREAARQGPEGIIPSYVALYRPWGFRLEDIAMDVHLWHGKQDTLVSLDDVEWVASRIPKCRLIIWDDAGHLGVAKHWDEVLAAGFADN
jgi:pimeloyl-ACP methyl ester carboxylesterase